MWYMFFLKEKRGMDPSSQRSLLLLQNSKRNSQFNKGRELKSVQGKNFTVTRNSQRKLCTNKVKG